MLALRVFEALRKTKVNDVDVVLGCVSSTNKEVIWLDIAMDDSFFVHLLNALDLYRMSSNWDLTIY